MKALMRSANSGSGGRSPGGRCYEAVWRYIVRVGYGNMPGIEVPWDYSAYAKNFAEYANLPGNLKRLGLCKLDIDNPYEAPPGAIVVVRPGTPGTGDPMAGDIAIAMGGGRFLNDGEMGYRGPEHFPPGNRHVLGIYVPAA
jgi:hypothetical protein